MEDQAIPIVDLSYIFFIQIKEECDLFSVSVEVLRKSVRTGRDGNWTRLAGKYVGRGEVGMSDSVDRPAFPAHQTRLRI